MRAEIESVKEFREKYFSAESRLQRAFLAVSACASSAFLLVFSVIWSAVPAVALVGAWSAEEETSSAAFCVLAGFLLIGVALFVFAIVRIARVIRILVSAPKVGSFVPASESLENPFSSAEEDEHVVHTEKNPQPLRVLLFLFGGVFFVVGIAISVRGVKKYFEEEAAAGTWISAPCRVVSAQLESRRGSKGGTTYSPEIVFEFSAEGKTFRGDRIFISADSSSSDYAKEKRRLAEYEARTECWFDPANPENCALMPPQSGFAPRKILIAVFGVPFWLIGGGLSLGAVFAGRSREKKGSAEAMLEEGLLRESVGAAASPAALMLFALAWNSIVSVFLVALFSDGEPSPLPALFLVPFVVIGAAILICAVRALAGLFGPRCAVKISPFPLVGGNARVSWKIVRGDPARVLSLKIEFSRMRDSKLVVNGRPKKKTVESVPVFETGSRALIASGETEISVPADVSPAEWRLTVVGKTAGTPFVPNLRQEFFLD